MIFFVWVLNIANIRLDSFWTERTKSSVTTQHAVEVVGKQNILNFCFFFETLFGHTFCFYFFFSFQTMVQTNGNDDASRIEDKMVENSL